MLLFNSIAPLGDCEFSPISLQWAQVKDFYDMDTALKELLFFLVEIVISSKTLKL